MLKPANLWTQQPVNVHPAERWIAAGLGVGLLARGLRRGSLLSLAAAACCFYRVVTGNCKGYQMLGISTRECCR